MYSPKYKFFPNHGNAENFLKAIKKFINGSDHKYGQKIIIKLGVKIKNKKI